MGIASLSTGAFAVAALCVAAFNLWIYWLRPRETAHLWLGVAAMGVMVIATGMASLYHAHTVEAAQRAQIVSLGGALPVVVGFLRFTALFVGVRMSRFEIACGSFTGLAMALIYAWPQVLFTGRGTPRELFGATYLEADLGIGAAVVFPAFLAMVLALAVVFVRYRRRIEDAPLILATLALFFLCTANDVAAGLRLYHTLLLMPIGFASFSIAFTAVLTRRFVHSMARVEASAEALQHLVEQKSQELREKDLQLVHGARMSTVGALATGLAQEIRRPVERIGTDVDELADSWKDAARSEAFEEVLAEAREQIERIRLVVSDLLRISRRGEGDVCPVDLAEIVRSMLPLVRHEATERARLECELEPVPPVEGRETLLAQVVLDLVVSALRRIPAGQPERHLVSVSTRHEDGSVWLTVRDTGPPIPQAELEHLFDAFRATETDVTGAAPGQLGLAVTHEIVARHRGRIGVETGPGGTAFLVELPPAEDTP